MDITGKRFALFSVSEKTEEVFTFARRLVEMGFTILSSGGTAEKIAERGIPVTDVSELTGQKAVLGHRVVTLHPCLHGGLLATEEMSAELAELNWPRIEVLMVTFYPLQAAMSKTGSTFADWIEKCDIGGPTLVRSANKGGNTIVVVDDEQVEQVLAWMEADQPYREANLMYLRCLAEMRVADYVGVTEDMYHKGYMSHPDYTKLWDWEDR